MKNRNLILLLIAICSTISFIACKEDNPYILQKEDIQIEQPTGGFVATINKSITIPIKSVSDEGINYKWLLAGQEIATTKELEYTPAETGEFDLQLQVSQGQIVFKYNFKLTVAEENTNSPYLLEKEDIQVEQPTGGFVAIIGKSITIPIKSVSDKGVIYRWSLAGQEIATTKKLEYTPTETGEFDLRLQVSQEKIVFEYDFKLTVNFPPITPPTQGATAFITKVLDYMPAVGQFTNKMPEYREGDTQESMNQKVLNTIGNNKKGTITLGGYGGYVVVGFDHTIENVKGKRDFRVTANAFYANANPDENAPEGGSCEPGIIMVAYDINKNGIPDENEWYEIEGSAHKDPTQELWYQKAKNNDNIVDTYSNYQITYYRPTEEPENEEQYETYIRWEDNNGETGYRAKNMYHSQPYYPLWAQGDKLTFNGTCLPQNGIDESGEGTYFVLYKFIYGYADNERNLEDESAIDIDWAINKNGKKVGLPGVDFIKVYTGVNQENGWLGECSTEIMNIEDLHILDIDIDTRQ